jgi:hypothetical protein
VRTCALQVSFFSEKSTGSEFSNCTVYQKRLTSLRRKEGRARQDWPGLHRLCSQFCFSYFVIVVLFYFNTNRNPMGFLI